MSNRENLIRLIRENPDLPIVPLVDGEITDYDGGWWLGRWGRCYIDEYLLCNDYIALKSFDDVFDVLERYLPAEDFEKLPETKSECRPYYDKLPWTKAIIVYINALD